MSDESETETAPTAEHSPSQRALTQFRERIAGNLDAIHAIALEYVQGRHNLEDVPAPKGIRVDITVGPSTESGSDFTSVDCYDDRVICGESETGYIYCTVHYCMEIGPITQRPQ